MNTDPQRNQPAEKGRKNDPDLRDRSDIEPGINTVSSSDYDEANQKITKTAADDFRTEDTPEPKADPTFDDIDRE